MNLQSIFSNFLSAQKSINQAGPLNVRADKATVGLLTQPEPSQFILRVDSVMFEDIRLGIRRGSYVNWQHGIKAGDTISLLEFEADAKTYSGRSLLVKVVFADYRPGFPGSCLVGFEVVQNKRRSVPANQA